MAISAEDETRAGLELNLSTDMRQSRNHFTHKFLLDRRHDHQHDRSFTIFFLLLNHERQRAIFENRELLVKPVAEIVDLLVQ